MLQEEPHTQEKQQNQSGLLSEYIDMTDEQRIEIDRILKSCGIYEVPNFEYAEDLVNAWGYEGKVVYRMDLGECTPDVIFCFNQDMKLDTIKSAVQGDLYKDGEVIAMLQDYYLSNDEIEYVIEECQDGIRELLIEPSTAVFPDKGEWVLLKEGKIVLVYGYVDAQNDVGDMVRGYFSLEIDIEKYKVLDMVFDRKELLR